VNRVRVRAIAKKEFIQIWRDPRSLALGLAIPVILIILFGYALSLDIDHVPMVVWNQDKSKTSVDFLLNFQNSKYFSIKAYYDNYRDLEHDINYGTAMMAMVIPRDFSRYMLSNQEAPVQLILDGSDSNTATIALGYAQAVVYGYNFNVISKSLRKADAPQLKVVDFRPRNSWPEAYLLKSTFSPGLAALRLPPPRERMPTLRTTSPRQCRSAG